MFALFWWSYQTFLPIWTSATEDIYVNSSNAHSKIIITTFDHGQLRLRMAVEQNLMRIFLV
jgi:hypothetical protein